MKKRGSFPPKPSRWELITTRNMLQRMEVFMKLLLRTCNVCVCVCVFLGRRRRKEEEEKKKTKTEQNNLQASMTSKPRGAGVFLSVCVCYFRYFMLLYLSFFSGHPLILLHRFGIKAYRPTSATSVSLFPYLKIYGMEWIWCANCLRGIYFNSKYIQSVILHKFTVTNIWEIF